MTSELYWAHRCYDRAYEQIEVLTDKLEELTTRYASSDRPFRRQIAIRKRTMRALIFVYYNYLRLKKSHILDLRFKIYGEDPFSYDSFQGGFFEEEDELEDHLEEVEDYDDVNDDFDESDYGETDDDDDSRTNYGLVPCTKRPFFFAFTVKTITIFRLS